MAKLQDHLNKKYFKDPSKNLYKLEDNKKDNEIYNQIKKYCDEKLSNLNIGNYTISFYAYDKNKADTKEVWSKQYNFELFESNIKILKEKQIDSYKSTKEFNPHFFVYSINPELNEQ